MKDALPSINDILNWNGDTETGKESDAGSGTEKSSAEKSDDKTKALSDPTALQGEKEQEKTPEEPEEEAGEEEEDEPTPLVEELRQMIGYETDAEYEDTTEGLVQLFRDSAERQAEQQLDRLFQEYPLVKALLEFQMNGGRDEDFVRTFLGERDYSRLEITEKDTALHERLLRDELARRGYSEEEILEEIEEAKSTGKLFKKAERALEVLKKAQEEEKQMLLQKQKEAAEAERRRQEELQAEVKKLIKTATELKGLPIPEKDKIAFEDFLFKPTASGKTGYQEFLEKADLQTEIAAAYLAFRGFDLSGLIERKAVTKKTQDLRSRLSGGLPAKSAKAPSKEAKTKDIYTTIEKIDHSALFHTS